MTNNVTNELTDKEKEIIEKTYKKALISLEILQLGEKPNSVEDAEKIYDELVQHKTFIIDDLSRNYVIRLSYTDKKSSINSVDPDVIPEGDMYELAESIQEILKAEGFPVIESNFKIKEDEIENV